MKRLRAYGILFLALTIIAWALLEITDAGRLYTADWICRSGPALWVMEVETKPNWLTVTPLATTAITGVVLLVAGCRSKPK
jgi:hypothetical protein